MNEDLQYWLDIAEYDLGTAKAMLDSGRYLYVLFMCQQAIEKLLKAHVTYVTSQFPPRLHNLLRLAELAQLDLNDNTKSFLEKLSYYYLECRYPEDRKSMVKEATKQVTEKYYQHTVEVYQWLKEKLILKT
ncbi:MAG: HEPN domain-containing protein [Candidatus Margulisbacteria bacterium]|nr:HEPN domain-containing protein [Candidatus Margulisiibacteriota bacterium]